MTDHDEHNIWTDREADTRYTRRAGLVIALIVACAAAIRTGVCRRLHALLGRKIFTQHINNIRIQFFRRKTIAIFHNVIHVAYKFKR